MKNNLREADAFLEENILPIGQSGHLNLVDEEGNCSRDFQSGSAMVTLPV